MSRIKKTVAVAVIAAGLVVGSAATAFASGGSGYVSVGSCPPNTTRWISSSISGGLTTHLWQYGVFQNQSDWYSGTSHSATTGLRTIDRYSVTTAGTLYGYGSSCN